MKALTIDGYGLEHVAVREVPDPQPAPGEVTVRVRAAALNRLDLWTLSGALKIPHEFPHVLGAVGAGTVEAVGEGVSGIRPGAEVMINPGTSCGRGGVAFGLHVLCAYPLESDWMTWAYVGFAVAALRAESANEVQLTEAPDPYTQELPQRPNTRSTSP